LERYVKDLNPRDPGLGRAREFARHADTRLIHYDIDPGFGVDADTLNRDIPRVVPAPNARSYDVKPVFAELTGKIRVPVMSLRETADFRVPFRLEQDYRRRAERAGTSRLLVSALFARPGIAASRTRCARPPSTIWLPGSRTAPCPPATMCSAVSASSAFGGRRCGIRRIYSNRRAQSLAGTQELTDDDD
jgi:hypothetical protein